MKLTGLALASLLSVPLAGQAPAADQATIGAGNQAAARLAAASPLVRSARQLVSHQIDRIGTLRLQQAIRDLVENPRTCNRHRAGETAV